MSDTNVTSPPDDSRSVITVASSAPVKAKRFPENLPDELNLVLGQTGKAYAVMKDAGNPYVLPVGSKQLNNLIRAKVTQSGHNLRQADIREIDHSLQAHAETAGVCRDVWYRVAPIDGGIEIDLGDNQHTRVRITAGRMDIVKEGSTSLFYRTSLTLPMCMPSGAEE